MNTQPSPALPQDTSELDLCGGRSGHGTPDKRQASERMCEQGRAGGRRRKEEEDHQSTKPPTRRKSTPERRSGGGTPPTLKKKGNKNIQRTGKGNQSFVSQDANLVTDHPNEKNKTAQYRVRPGGSKELPRHGRDRSVSYDACWKKNIDHLYRST